MESDSDRSDVPVNKRRRAKPRVVKEWEEKDICKLISLVEAEKCLWDAGDEGYHNKILRDCAWRNIAEHFDSKYAPDDLNAKWTNLRIQFRGYVNRAKTKSGQEVPKWRFYNNMTFVDRTEEKKNHQTVSNIAFEEVWDSNSQDHFSPLTPALSTQRQAEATRRRQQVGSNQSVAIHMAKNMHETVTAIQERGQNSFAPNATFSNYLMSELNTLSDDSSAIVRKKVMLFFLQCVDEERVKQL